MSHSGVYKCVERFEGRETSVMCARSGWPANVTCVEFREIWRENFDGVVSDRSCEQLVSRSMGTILEECDSYKCRRLAKTNTKMRGQLCRKGRVAQAVY
jgi:hypothetical protein